jgi:hypothetical protein
MARSGVSRAQENKRVRQEALREWLSNKCTAQHLVDNLAKIEALDPTSETFNQELAKYKTANEQRFKVLDKYLPTEKYVEADVTTTEMTYEQWLESIDDSSGDA